MHGVTVPFFELLTVGLVLRTEAAAPDGLRSGGVVNGVGFMLLYTIAAFSTPGGTLNCSAMDQPPRSNSIRLGWNFGFMPGGHHRRNPCHLPDNLSTGCILFPVWRTCRYLQEKPLKKVVKRLPRRRASTS